MAKASAHDDKALIIQGRAISEKQFNDCVRRVLQAMRERREFHPRKTAQVTNLDERYLHRVASGERMIGLFTMWKLAEAGGVRPSKIAALVEAEVAKEIGLR